MKKILTDIDGVVLDWEHHFHQWMQYQGYERSNEENNTYDLHVSYAVEKPAVKMLVKQFNESAWIGHCEPFRDALVQMGELVDEGFVFEAITSLSTDYYAGISRQRNLTDLFGYDTFSKVTCLDTGADKDEALALFKDSGLFFIEDKWENAVLGAELGLKSIIMDHSHNKNQSHPKIIRARNWYEIKEIIFDHT
jgi:uncharacterized HAD superfamily protein